MYILNLIKLYIIHFPNPNNIITVKVSLNVWMHSLVQTDELILFKICILMESSSKKNIGYFSNS